MTPKRALIIYGPRRVGKTTLLKSFLSSVNLKYKLVTGDSIKTQEVLGSQNIDEIRDLTEGYDLLAIDEGQYVPNIGLGLKSLPIRLKV